MRRRLGAIAIALASSIGLAPSCASPTKITLDIRTDIDCATTKGTTITAGVPGATERAGADITSRRCLPGGELGTVVLTPASGDGGRVAVRVVMGVDAPVETCTAENAYKGCIVQRRQLAYIQGTALEVPVDMLLVCVDVPCDETSTCAANGRCVPATIDDPRECEVPRRCYPEGDGPVIPDPAATDGGPQASDAGGGDGQDASADGGIGDGGPDAADGGDGGDGGGETGSNGVQCGPSDTCSADTSCCILSPLQRLCTFAQDACDGVAIRCDGPEDCRLGEVCCVQGMEARCSRPGSCSGPTLCHSDGNCAPDVCLPQALYATYGMCAAQ